MSKMTCGLCNEEKDFGEFQSAPNWPADTHNPEWYFCWRVGQPEGMCQRIRSNKSEYKYVFKEKKKIT